ncbi:MAG: TonB-dependent receptor, partial [Lewinella sp.]
MSTLGFGQLTLEGTVREPGGDPVVGAVVNLRSPDGELNTLTDADGYFMFSDLSDQDYRLNVRSTGLKSGPRNVNPTTVPQPLSITVEVDEVQLQQVEVVGRARRDYQSLYSFSATKTAILNEDLPQSLTSVTKELIDDRQAFALQDAVKTVSSVAPTGLYNHFAIRGITANEDGQVINGLRTRSYYFLQPLTANVERIEVLKGPATVTFASADPGGTVNIVTKKPLDIERKEISLSAGSFSTLRGTLDFTGPLNEDKTLLYRVNAAYQENRSYRDLIDNTSLQLSPSLSYVPNDKTFINTELILNDMRGYLDRGQPVYGGNAGEVDLTSTPISENLGESNDFLNENQFIWTTSFSHRLSSAVSFNAVYMKQTWEEDLVEHRSVGTFAPDLEGNEISSLVERRYI